MREQLLGYLLGALEPAEQEVIEARLSEDPQLRRELEELRAHLAPFEDTEGDEEELDPPPGLGARTFRFVRNHAGWSALGQGPTGASGGAWRAPDYLIAAGIFIATSMLVFPAVHKSRIHARQGVCQNNLRIIGLAVSQYGQIFQILPPVPAEGHMAAAGVYGPVLQFHGLLPNPSVLVCPDSQLAVRGDFRVPGLAELDNADPETLQHLHRVMGGSYGYHPGHIIGGRYYPTRAGNREFFAIMADAVDEMGADHSANHGHRGQSVLSQSGRVFFAIVPRLVENGDHIYVNDLGVKGAGQGLHDSSICNSPVPPIVVPVSTRD